MSINDKEGITISIYDFSVQTHTGEEQSLCIYKGKVLLIVNTASQCGFTPQYEGLQKLYTTYHKYGFEVLTFPCNQFLGQEPGTDDEIQQFCQTHYQITFPVFSKVNVRGKQAHPLFQYLSQAAPGLWSKTIQWNFTKFLVDSNGEVVKRFAPSTPPHKIEPWLEKLLQIHN